MKKTIRALACAAALSGCSSSQLAADEAAAARAYDAASLHLRGRCVREGAGVKIYRTRDRSISLETSYSLDRDRYIDKQNEI